MQIYKAYYLFCGLILFVFSGACARADDLAINGVSQRADGGFYLSCASVNEIRRYSDQNALSVARALEGVPTDMTWSAEQGLVAVTVGEGDGWLYLLNDETLEPYKVIASGHSPLAAKFSPSGKRLALAQRFRDEVWVYDTQTWLVVAVHTVLREPVDLVWRDEGQLVVLHHLSNRPADADWTGCSMATLDIVTGDLVEIPLEDGSTGARKLALTSDARYALAPMVIASHRVPATQIEQGWINKNGLTVVDLDARRMLGTLLLDDVFLGAANPWDIALGNERAWISLAGVHQVMSVDYPALIDELNQASPKQREDFSYNLRKGHAWKTRMKIEGIGPRSVSIDQTNERVLVASFFNNAVESIDLDTLLVTPLLQPREVATARRGELLFHDGTICFQEWMSCSSCHPDARTDALNWDLENDGLGTQRQAKSMLLAHQTPPTTITGIRPNAETSVRAGISFLRTVLPESDAEALDVYLSGLQQVPSPFLEDGELSADALAGKALFHGKAACIDCHDGEHYTNQALRRVGTGLGDEVNMKYDVPTLREVWRSAPYLHDGRAVSIKDMLTTHNPSGRHGDADLLTREELDQLIEYVQTL